MAPAIEIVGVTKRFRRHTEPSKSIKERFLSFRKNEVRTFDALHDINLEVESGETIGLLGHNGSGKSTLLKCIAGTIRPTEGEIRVRGRMAAMLELGAGFHPDLTGRENVYLNGSILGFAREHVNRIFDEIVAFAELEEFIDQQVKYYSSGMFARLGFAVAVNLEPDVLLVDEVLAVGDENFQRKCLERVRRFQTEGRTIVLVTHAPDQVIQLCDRALVLDHGHPLHIGDTTEAVRVFRHALHASSGTPDPVMAEAAAAARGGALTIVGASATGPDGTGTLQPGDPATVELRYRATESIGAARARIVLTTHDGVQMLNASTFDLLGHDLFDISGDGTIRFRFEHMPLLDGTYRIGFVLQDPSETFQYDENLDACTFDVYTGNPIVGRVQLDVAVEHVTGQPAA
jgi:ABC-2 type transport system ATP-binding protein